MRMASEPFAMIRPHSALGYRPPAPKIIVFGEELPKRLISVIKPDRLIVMIPSLFADDRDHIMKTIRTVVGLLVLVVIGLVWLAPLGTLPGIFIGGTETDVPDRWGDTSSMEEILLEVPGSPPRVVTIWVIQVEGELFISGANESGWVKMLGAGGPVRARMGDSTYSLQASIVTTGWQDILKASRNKYSVNFGFAELIDSWPPVEESAGTTTVFRLARG
jgi:hypothetical protein